MRERTHRSSIILLAFGALVLGISSNPPASVTHASSILASSSIKAQHPTSVLLPGNGHVIIGALTCISTSHCIAAGEGVSGSTTTQGEVFLFNGLRWVPMATNDITQVNGDILSGVGTLPAVIHGISCPSSTDCWVAGTDAGGNFLAELSTAGFVAHPWNPPNTARTGIQPISTALYSIDCPTRSQCWASGSSATGALILRYDGSTWQKAPEPFDTAAGALLEGVSCSSTTACIAVGTRITGLTGHAIAAVWNGHAWKSESLATNYRVFTHVACAESFCLISTRTASGVELLRASPTGGKTAAIPTTLSAITSIDALHCTRSGFCTASGLDSKGAFLLEGGPHAWHVMKLPSPGSGLTAVSPIGYCTSTNACTVVDNARSRSGEWTAIPATTSGTRWTAGEILSMPAIPNEALVQMVCAHDGYCLAEQSETTSVQHKPDALYSIAGSHVAPVPIPTPFSYTYDSLRLLNCISPSQCFAIVVADSFETLPNGNGMTTFHAAVVEWNGSSWTVLSTGTLPGDSVEGYCVSSTLCWFSDFGQGTTANLPGNPPHPSYISSIYRMSGHSWSSVPIPNLSNETILTSMSCAGPDFCMAGGTNNTTQLFLAFQHGTWRIIPSSPKATWTLSIDCVAPENCWMLDSGSTVTVEHYVGATQPIQSISEPYIPTGISCIPSGRCYWLTDTRTSSGELYTLESDQSGVVMQVSSIAESQSNFSPRDVIESLTCSATSCYAIGYTMPWIHLTYPLETMQSIPLLEQFPLPQ